MDKIPPNHSQQTQKQNKSKQQQETEEEGDNHTEIRAMGASPNESSSPLDPYLLSSNSAIQSDFVATITNQSPSNAMQRTKVDLDESTITIPTDVDHRNKRRKSFIEGTNDDRTGKKQCFAKNLGTSMKVLEQQQQQQQQPQSVILNQISGDGKDFAQEFVDSDNSLYSSEEELETSQVPIHETIQSPMSTSSVAPVSGTTIPAEFDKSERKTTQPKHGFRTPSIDLEQTQSTISGLKYSKIDNVTCTVPSQDSSSTSQLIPDSPSTFSSAGKINNFHTIPSNHPSSKTEVTQVLSPTNNDAPTTIVSKRVGEKKALPNISTGRWTRPEHEAFLVGLKKYGREWKKVSYNIPTRTSAQIRSHAQKYFAKVAREEQQRVAALAASSHLASSVPISGGGGGTDDVFGDQGTIHSLDNYSLNNFTPRMIERFHRILKEPDTVRREVEDTLCRLRNRYNELQRAIEKKQQERRLQQGGIPSTKVDTENARSDSIDSSTVKNDCNPQKNLNKIINPSSASSQPVMTVPIETKQTLTDGETKSDSIVNPDDVRRYIDSDEGSLARKELIALHVLGSTLHRSVSQDNINKKNDNQSNHDNKNKDNQNYRGADDTANEVNQRGTGLSIGLEENRSSRPTTQDNNSTEGPHKRNVKHKII